LGGDFSISTILRKKIQKSTNIWDGRKLTHSTHRDGGKGGGLSKAKKRPTKEKIWGRPDEKMLVGKIQGKKKKKKGTQNRVPEPSIRLSEGPLRGTPQG